ncbi:MAG: dihydrolipoyllysine-residue acetyltransferase [Gammaproteobacteria bacterium]|jgi:pyruvate dehydrogenase E2 component (dihydrolipoamide acetyltransferase)|nr:dihydrolipoyllysine-residue acetyltransferase [Gammaproteobacteria bacterium]MBT4492582.1 dihydrolipoyllysine-residue acetyltransferase [Gammaproteobacteria bacterium]MBT7370589.1 dihydrolipoyllysine-residue acetyltransferase [Gammaproteobacteria bacterium]
MTMVEQVLVPDVGEAQGVEVVELLVAVGDFIKADASILVLESDKASMEIPSPCGGRIATISVNEGDLVEEGTLLVEIEVVEIETAEADVDVDVDVEEPAAVVEPVPEAEPDQPVPVVPPTTEPQVEKSHVVQVPDVGDAQEVVVVEILVHQGDRVEQGDSLVVLESDKASMEIPADMSGVVQELMVNEGDEVAEGAPLVTLVGRIPISEVKDPEPGPVRESRSHPPLVEAERQVKAEAVGSQGAVVYAGPAVRKQAREYGVDIDSVKGSGRKGRILKEDIQEYVKAGLSQAPSAGGAGIPEIPVVDFAKYGEIEEKPLSRIRKASARNLHRSWLNVPHVTQFDEADITELEDFRRQQNVELQARGGKLTPLAFLVCAVVDTLKTFPQFNASLGPDYEHLILKHYYNIGVAVETDDGLVVPVLKDADKKGVVQLAEESALLATQARENKLPMDAMQGATFTISSLGGIGGTAFTPIVNAPEVAILGVSRSKVAPVYNGDAFEPRTMLPLSLSYDHRAIDGAEAARFTSHLSKVLSDIRRVIL